MVLPTIICAYYALNTMFRHDILNKYYDRSLPENPNSIKDHTYTHPTDNEQEKQITVLRSVKDTY